MQAMSRLVILQRRGEEGSSLKALGEGRVDPQMTVVGQREYPSLREQGNFKAMVYRATADHSLEATLKMGPCIGEDTVLGE